MKKYKVKVNGKVYEVELEKVSETEERIQAPAASNAQPLSGEGTTISAPLQGKIFKIPVKVGDKINSGDIVVVIEAMKMENEIQTTKTGVVKEILVNVGSDVDTNQPLVVIE